MMQLRLTVLILASVALMTGCTPKSGASPEVTEQTPTVEKITETYPNGFVKLRGRLLDGNRSGLWESFYDNGYRWSEVQYVRGKRDGPTISYHPNGLMRYQGQYSGGDRRGIWMFYDTTGVLVERIDMDASPARTDTLNIETDPT